MSPTRRDFLKGALGGAGAVVLGRSVAGTAMRPAVNIGPLSVPSALPVPGRSGIDHVVVVMMENRSFDHFMGWMPNANGIGLAPDGTVVDEAKFASFTYPDSSGTLHPIWRTTQLNGCGQQDQDHGYTGGRIQRGTDAQMKGFLLDPENTGYALSYYLADARQFSTQLALEYTTCDNYFCSILTATWPNRFFQHAAQTDRLNDTTAPDSVAPDSTGLPASPSTVPTIWDQLNQPGGPTGRYYFSDLPFLALWGAKYLPISAQYPQFLADAAAGTLPNVSFVDPRFEDEGSGTSGDDHPLSDLRAGDAFLSEVFHALADGPLWDRTMLVVNYDEWGGFFDHVPPPFVAPGNQYIDTVDVQRDAGGRITGVLSGFRVPCIVASPRTKGDPSNPRVVSTMFDHTSVLAFVESNWGLAPLTPRDASIPADSASTSALSNLSCALAPTSDARVPDLPLLAPFVSSGCDVPGSPAGGPTVGGEALGVPPASARPANQWSALKASSLLRGWR
jgi:phospholipase C